MTAESPIINRLEDLAREQSSDSRRELLRELTDMFLSQSLDQQGISENLFSDVVGLVVEEAETSVRAELSERLADEENAPRGVVLKLAEDDEIYVASPILKRSNALSDEDLVNLVSTKGEAHLMAISDRPVLPAQVTDVLVDRGSQNVVRKVTSNKGAEFSGYGFNRLVERSSSDEQLQAALVERQDLPQDVVTKLEPMLSDKLKQRLSQMNMAVSGEQMGLLSQEAKRRLMHKLKTTRIARDPDALFEYVRMGYLSLDEAIAEACATERLLDIAALLSKIVGLTRDICVNILAGGNDDAVGILSRCAQLSSTAYLEILRLRERRHPNQRMNYRGLIESYERISEENAQRLIRFIKVRQAAMSGDQSGSNVA